MSASKIAPCKSTQPKSPPKPPTRFIPKSPVIVDEYLPSELELDGSVAFSFTTVFERDAAGKPRFAIFNFGGNATQRVPLTEGTLLGKTVLAALSIALDTDIERLEKTFAFTYGILLLSYETDITCDKKADGTVKHVNSRTIRATPLDPCRVCGFRIVGKGITSAHGVDSAVVAVHERCYGQPFTFMARDGTTTITCTPIKVGGKAHIGVTEETGVYHVVNYNFVPVTDAGALLDLSVDDTQPDGASSCSDLMTLDEDDAPIAKAAPKKRRAPTSKKPTQDDASSCTDGDAPAQKKRPCPAACDEPAAKKPCQLDLALDELASMFASGTPSQLRLAALFGKYVLD